METNAAKADGAHDDAPAQPQFGVVNGGAPASAGVRRVNLGSLTKATKNKNKYPILPDPTGVIATAVDQYLAQHATFEALEGSLKGLRAEFGQWARPFYYQACRGLGEIPSSVMALGYEANQVLLTLQDRYPSVEPDWDTLGGLLGDKLPDAIAETFEIKIDGSKIPPDSQQSLIEEVTALFVKYNAATAITAKIKVKPTAGFHTLRHQWLSPEQNLALDCIMPCVMSVKTKGVKR